MNIRWVMIIKAQGNIVNCRMKSYVVGVVNSLVHKRLLLCYSNSHLIDGEPSVAYKAKPH